MFRSLLIICLIFLLTVSTMAQDGYPLPDDLVPIASDNAVRLQQLASVGSLLQGQLLWSPDGTTLVVATSADVRLYSAADFSAAPIVIPDTQKGGSFFGFNRDGELVINGQRWSIQTGALLGAIPPAIVPTVDTRRYIAVEVLDENGLKALRLSKPDGDIVTLQLNTPYDYQDILFNPDNTVAAIVIGEFNYAYSVQIWNLETGALLTETRLTTELIDTFTFHADGQLLIAATYTEALYGGAFEDVQIWDGRTGQPYLLPLNGYLPVKFSPDGELFAFLADTGIAVWSNRELGILTFPDEYYADEGKRPILFSPDSTTIASKAENEILLWNVNPNFVPSEPSHTIATEEPVVALLYNADGSLLVSLEANGVIEVWDTATYSLQTRIAATKLYELYLSRDGNLVRSKDNRNTLTWDVYTGELLMTVPNGAVSSADWAMAAYWKNGNINVAYLDSQDIIELNVIPDYTGRLVAFNPIAGWGVFSDDTITAYDLTSGEAVFSHSLGIVWLTIDGQYLLIQYTPTDATGAILDIYEVANPQQVVVSIPAYQNALPSPSAKYIAYMLSACGDGGGGTSSLYDLANDVSITFYPGDECGPYSHAFSLDEKWLVVGWDYTVTLLNIEQAHAEVTENGMLPYNTDSVITIPFRAAWEAEVLFNADGSLLAVVANAEQYVDNQFIHNTSVEIWRFDELITQGNSFSEPMLRIDNATQAVFSPGSQYLATNLGLWSLTTGEQVAGFNIFTGATAFNSDSTLLATYSENTVTLWDVSVLEHGHGDAVLVTLNIPDVQELAFNPDSTLLYIKRAGDVQVWGVVPR